MKKIYSLLIAAAAAGSITAGAQQLPSYGFEDEWEDCVPWNSKHLTKTQGTQPSGWCISNVTSSANAACQTVGAKVAGYNSNNAIQVQNKTILSQTIPGYFTLGTTWSTAKATGVGTVASGTADGGTWGGMPFTYRPDALQFDYKRPSSTGQPATILIYSWVGETQQADVPAENTYGFFSASNPTKEAIMYNRDRTIIDEMTSDCLGGNVTKSADFELVAKTVHKITTQVSDWSNAIIDIDYKTSSAPTKFNIIFSASDYLANRSNLGSNDELHVDNVKLLYYSRLASLSVDGTSVDGFDSNTYSYTIDSEMPAESAFVYTTLGNSGSAKATLSLDEANAVATITVTNSNNGGTDVDGETTHTYTIQFNKPSQGKTEVALDENAFGVYNGIVTVLAKDAGLGDEDIERNGNVKISDNGKNNGTCSFLLPDFALTDEEDGYIGDISINDVEIKKYSDGTYTVSGFVNPLNLTMGGNDIVAKVTVNGEIDANGLATMDIAVIWLMDPVNDPDGTEMGFPINVKFNGQKGKEKVEYSGEVFNGNVTVLAKEAGLADEDIVRAGEVHIITEDDSSCTFVLPDFALTDEADGYIGDIVVPGLTVTESNGIKTYEGIVKGLQLTMAGNDIVANVTVNGTVNAQGIASMQISVIWLMDPENDPEGTEMGFPINVLFNGQNSSSAGIRDIISGNGDEDAPVEYYNLNGVRVNGENIAPGIYIRRQGNDVKKILVK